MHEKITLESEDKVEISKDAPDDLGSMFLHIARMLPVKLIILTFITYLSINTTNFIESILSRWNGAVEGRCPTERGIVIQGLLLVLAMIVFHITIEAGYL